MIWFGVSIQFAVDAEFDMPPLLRRQLLNLQWPDEDASPRALRYCCRNGHKFVVSALLEHGVNANAKDRKGRNALFYVPPGASWYKSMMRRLIAAGGDVADRSSGNSLLHHYIGFDYVTNRRRVGPVQDLTAIQIGFEFALANGLRINMEDTQGLTALSYCMYAAEIKLILKMGACIRTAYQSTAGLGMLLLHEDPETLALLLSKSSPLRNMFWDGQPLCHWVVETNRVKFAAAACKVDLSYFARRLPPCLLAF
jgi:ankyrin repeat protein